MNEARQLFDQGMTVPAVAAELGLSYSTAAYLCQPPAPTWPTFTPEQLARMPAQLRAQVIASNPNHAKP